jgi:hypothetical protein
MVVLLAAAAWRLTCVTRGNQCEYERRSLNPRTWRASHVAKAGRGACFPCASASWLGPRSRYRCGRAASVSRRWSDIVAPLACPSRAGAREGLPRLGEVGSLQAQTGGRRHHWGAPGVDGRDDLLGRSLGGRSRSCRGWCDRAGAGSRSAARPRASSTAWAWRSWCGANRRRTPASAAKRRNSTRTPALDQGSPRVGPSMMQNSAPTGSSIRAASHGCSWSQPHASMPISRRRPPLPLRTSSDPRLGSRSRSASASGSWMRRPPRQSTTISARSRQPCRSSVAWRITGDDLLHGRWVGGIEPSLVAGRPAGVVARQRRG